MRRKIIPIVCTVVPVLSMIALSVALFNLSQTMGELRTEISRSQADAILASADVENDTVVSVPILYYDQVADECVDLYDAGMASALNARQFEWSKCGYYNKNIETGITQPILNKEYLPTASGGDMLPNRGVNGDNFTRWFSAVEGKSKAYAGTLGLKFSKSTSSFSYENEEFYPLNSISVPDEAVNRDGNNHLFTFNLGVPVQVLADGNEEFSIYADDDTWVYIGDKIVIDMGGVHEATTARFKINNEGEVYSAVNGEELAYSGVKLTRDTGAIVRIFHADRDSTESVFNMRFSKMVLNLTKDATLAKGDSVEVAYDPTNPSYIAPLGESLVEGPNRTNAMVASMVALVAVVVVLMAITIVSISVALKYSPRGRSQE